MLDTDELTVSLEVTNTGRVAGKEIVQLYVSDQSNRTIHPKKELKNFVKVELQPGETQIVSMTLNKRSFSWYNPKISDWDVNSGQYEILIGKSVSDIVLRDVVTIHSTTEQPLHVTVNTTLGDLMNNVKLKPLIDSLLEGMNTSTDDVVNAQMKLAMMKDMPLRALRSFQGVDNYLINSLVMTLNKLLQ